MAPQDDIQPQLGFQARRDFMAPYINLKGLWEDLRPTMIKIPALRATLPNHLPQVSAPPLVPITEVMIGPSGHQSLNVRATKLLIQATGVKVAILTSNIPYRSFS